MFAKVNAMPSDSRYFGKLTQLDVLGPLKTQTYRNYTFQVIEGNIEMQTVYE